MAGTSFTSTKNFGEPLRTQNNSVSGKETIAPDLRKSQGMDEKGKPEILSLLKDYEVYDDAKENLLKLEQTAESLELEANTNRDLRYANVDVEAERKSGKLQADEVYTPIHLIDTNIRREQAKLIAYITSSRRSFILKAYEKPDLSTEILEQDFTIRCRYDGWQQSFFRGIDCMQLHKHGIFEVLFDDTKPGDFCVEDVPYEDFPMPSDTRDIQAQEMLLRRLPFTKSQLVNLVLKRGFDGEQVKKVIGSFEQKKDVSTVKIEKVMFRKDGVIWVGWSCVKFADDWLRAPRKLFLGKKQMIGGQPVDVYETKYPFVVAPYNISEDTCLSDGRGRAALDQWDQEAVTSLQSSYLTAVRRSTYFCFGKDSDDPNSTGKVTNVKVHSGAIIDSKLTQFVIAAPDATTMGAIQSISQFNSQQQSQIDYTAMNREDSKKTATEIQAAQAEGQLLSTTQVALFSNAMKQVGAMCFEIYVSRVVAGFIRPPVPMMYYTMFTYQVRPAGDVDVIERQENLARMSQFWPIVSQTAIAVPFLQQMLLLAFPNKANEWNAQIQQDQTKNQLLMALSTVLKAAVVDPHTGHIEPQFEHEAPNIINLFSQVQQVLNPQAAKQSQRQQPKQLAQ